jgi:hypothetical protein
MTSAGISGARRTERTAARSSAMGMPQGYPTNTPLPRYDARLCR